MYWAARPWGRAVAMRVNARTGCLRGPAELYVLPKRIFAELCAWPRGARVRSMGDAEAAELAAALKSNTSVKVLKLRYNEIRDAGATALAEAIEHHPTLETLALGNNLIGSRQVGWLSLADAPAPFPPRTR